MISLIGIYAFSHLAFVGLLNFQSFFHYLAAPRELSTNTSLHPSLGVYTPMTGFFGQAKESSFSLSLM